MSTFAGTKIVERVGVCLLGGAERQVDCCEYQLGEKVQEISAWGSCECITCATLADHHVLDHYHQSTLLRRSFFLSALNFFSFNLFSFAAFFLNDVVWYGCVDVCHNNPQCAVPNQTPRYHSNTQHTVFLAFSSWQDPPQWVAH